MDRAAKPHFGLAFLRAGLAWSWCFMLVGVFVRLVSGVWLMDPAVWVFAGFLMAAAWMVMV